MIKIARVVLFAFAFGLSARAGMTPMDLCCDYAVNPAGVDSQPPRLFWKLESRQRDQRQSAYQILVASSPALLKKNEGDLWDSGKVASDETIQIDYAGKKMNSGEEAFWKVRVWDAREKVSGWSRPANWIMGVLESSDWHARWIGAANTNIASLRLRRDFVVKAGLKRALVNVCGLGQYEMTLNGKQTGDDFLSPGWTKYDKTCLYDTRDITDLLRQGENTVGLELGNGMYQIPLGNRYAKFRKSFGPQKAIAQIRLDYADGSTEFIGTDGSWHAAAGPITFTSVYGGEDFDAWLAQPGWNQPGFDDAKWQSAITVKGPGGDLRGLSCAAPPVREFETHPSVLSYTLTNGDVVFDLGQNAAHVLEVSLSGAAGGQVRLLPSELTNRDGSIDQSSMGGGRRGNIWCDYTKSTDGVETWSPKFFYVGCRYVQAHRTAARPKGAAPEIKSVAGIVVHSSSEPVGTFECSNDLFNRTFMLVRWAQQNNMMSLLTDCPHRERLGWLEEYHLNGPALRYDFNLAQLFTKTLNDIADSQLTNGLVPTTAPEYMIFNNKRDAHPRDSFGDSPEWSSSSILVPWQQYDFDGDLNLFRLHYAAMTHYLAYLGSRSTNFIVSYGLSDWYDLGPKKAGFSQLTPAALTGTAFYYEDAIVMSRAASLLGKTDDAKKFSALAKNIRAAFNKKFYNAAKDCYATDSQCGNAIPLVMGLCEPVNCASVLNSIIADIRAHGNALTAGDVGYRYLLRALADGGRSDIIFEMNDQTNHPGYGMQLAKGKTSLTENWDGGSSQDHFMLGQIQEWFYHDLAGIQDAPESPGFKNIVIAPQPVGDLTRVNASYRSIRGDIVSDWKTGGADGRKFNLKISIPANTLATVYIPATSPQIVTESGKPAGQRRGVTFLRDENGRVVYAVESGNYDFSSVF
jgi:alpha-L-rhamnosidase